MEQMIEILTAIINENIEEFDCGVVCHYCHSHLTGGEWHKQWCPIPLMERIKTGLMEGDSDE